MLLTLNAAVFKYLTTPESPTQKALIGKLEHGGCLRNQIMAIESTSDQAVITSGQVARTSSLGQSLAAFAFGAVVLFAVGFLPMDAAHNAAHDTRHALAFPCH